MQMRPDFFGRQHQCKPWARKEKTVQEGKRAEKSRVTAMVACNQDGSCR